MVTGLKHGCNWSLVARPPRCAEIASTGSQQGWRPSAPGPKSQGITGEPGGLSMRSMRATAILGLMAISLAPAVAADLKPRPLLKAPPPPPSAFWIGAEYLIWSSKGDRLPPLVTTSPPGTPQAQAGVLGAPGTTVLFGNDGSNDRWRSGARVRAGYWLDPQHSSAIEANVFILDRSSAGFAASSDGNPILAQPFVNALTSAQDSILIAFPGTSSGSITISDPSRLFGAGADYRMELCRSCALGSVSGLAGYRFLWLRDNLTIDRTQVSGPALLAIPVGTIFAVEDQFATSNFFHGLDLGLTGDVRNGPWGLTWTAKVALGVTVTDVDINGAMTTTLPGGAPVTTAGGVYALPTNIGSFSSARFAAAPEFAAELGYQVNANVRVFAGYSLLYWTALVRPGGTIDTTLNQTQIGGPLAGPARPQPQSNVTDYWAQGLNFGASYRF